MDQINQIVEMFGILKHARKEGTDITTLLDKKNPSYNEYLKSSQYAVIISKEMDMTVADVTKILLDKKLVKVYGPRDKKEETTVTPMVIITDLIFDKKGDHMKSVEFFYIDSKNQKKTFPFMIANSLLDKLKGFHS